MPRCSHRGVLLRPRPHNSEHEVVLNRVCDDGEDVQVSVDADTYVEQLEIAMELTKASELWQKIVWEDPIDDQGAELLVGGLQSKSFIECALVLLQIQLCAGELLQKQADCVVMLYEFAQRGTIGGFEEFSYHAHHAAVDQTEHENVSIGRQEVAL